ncbi:MAG: hypothetical protein ACREQ9_16065 [Candidatus Binatia bacterium]
MPVLPKSSLAPRLAVLALLLSFAPAAAEPDLPPGRDHEFRGDEEGRALTIQKEYQDAGRELAETHAEALRKPELQGPLQELSDALKAEMIRLAPEQKETIEKRYAVHAEMREIEKIEQPTEFDKERYQALLLDFTNTTEALDDLPKRAANTPGVLVQREKFRKVLVEVMTKMNPKVPDLMEQQQHSFADYQDLHDDLLKKHGAAPVPATSGSEAPKD